MKTNIPCELIQDLFPSYIDGLTSEVTNQKIQEHVEECEPCKEMLCDMQQPEPAPILQKRKDEIDYLKKTKKHIRNFLVSFVATVILILGGVLGARMFFIASPVNQEYLVYDLSVNGQSLQLRGCALSDIGIKEVSIEEHSAGMIQIEFLGVQQKLLHDAQFEQQYMAEGMINEVRIGDQIVWSNGQAISPITSAVYETKHPYIGDMSANGRTVGALGMTSYLGGFTNELQTTNEPYGWKIILQKQYSKNRQAQMEERMHAYAYLLLSQIDNLGSVTFSYMIEDEECELTVDTKMASAYAGADIKQIGADIVSLERLIQQTGLHTNAQISSDPWNVPGDAVYVDCVNFTQDEIQSIGIGLYVDGEIKSSQGSIFADESLIGQGQVMNFQLLPEDLGVAWKDAQCVEIEIRITDAQGQTHPIAERVQIDAWGGSRYRVDLYGSSAEGYSIK
ncbi:MAG: DUF4825 domain-containing protein [Eubacterium sp.]|nr:DUF4825 domain-containing protein [Eubacterium sp.]